MVVIVFSNFVMKAKPSSRTAVSSHIDALGWALSPQGFCGMWKHIPSITASWAVKVHRRTTLWRHKNCENQGSEGKRKWLQSSRARKEERRELKCLRRRHTKERRKTSIRSELGNVNWIWWYGNQFGVSFSYYCLAGRTVTYCQSIIQSNKHRFLLCIIKNPEGNPILQVRPNPA